MATDIAPHNMVSDSSPSPYIISASTEYHGTAGGYRAFDGGVGTSQYWIATETTTAWLKIDLSSNSDIVNYYALSSNTIPEPLRMPREWTFQGSNNDSDWYVLDTVTEQTSWGSGETRYYNCDDVSTAYRYYKIVITLNNGDPSYTVIGEMYLYAGGSSSSSSRSSSSMSSSSRSSSSTSLSSSSRSSSSSCRSSSSSSYANVAITSNDLFADRYVISSLPSSPIGNNTGFSKETGEPNYGYRSAWFEFVATSTDKIMVDTIGSGFDTMLGVYTGTAVNALSTIIQDDDSGGSGTSRVAFTPVAGTSYKIAVTSYSSFHAGAQYNLNIKNLYPASNDNFANRITLTGTTFSASLDLTAATKETGETTSGSYSAWYEWTAPQNGTIRIARTAGTLYSAYTSVWTGTAVDALTKIADLQYDSDSVKVTSGTVYKISISSNSYGTWSFSGNYVTPPDNNDFANRILLTGSSFSQAGTNVWANTETGEGSYYSVWYEWVATSNGSFVIDLPNTNSYYLYIGVYTGSTIASLSYVAGSNYRVYFTASAGTSYKIKIYASYQSSSNQMPFVLTGAYYSAPGNDNFADRIYASGVISASGNNTMATYQSGEPSSSIYHSVWYDFTPLASGSYILDVAGNFSNRVYVCTGTDLGALSTVNYDYGGTTAHLRFESDAGISYKICVGGYADYQYGPFTISCSGYYPPDMPNYTGFYNCYSWDSRNIARDSTGAIWFVTYSYDEDSLVVYKSTNNGQSFDSHYNVPLLYSQWHDESYLVLLINSTDSVCLFASERDNNNYYSIMYYELDTNLGTWSTPEKVLDANLYYYSGIAATIDYADRIHFTFRGQLKGDTSSNYHLFQARKEPTWGSISRVFPSLDEGIMYPIRMDTDSSGIVHLFCTRRETVGGVYNYSMVHGTYDGSWDFELMADDGSYSYDLVSDLDDNIHIAYIDDPWENIKYRKKTLGTWGTEEVAVYDYWGDFDYPSLSVPLSEDTIRVLYQDYSTDNDTIKCAVRASGVLASGIWASGYLISDPEDTDMYMGDVNTRFSGLGYNAPASGYYLSSQGYDNYINWDNEAYFIYTDDLGFTLISTSGYIFPEALSFSSELNLREQWLGAVEPSGMVLYLSPLGGYVNPWVAYIDSLSMEMTKTPNAILTPTQKLSPVAGIGMGRSWSPFSIEHEHEQTESFSGNDVEPSWRNMRAISERSDRPIKFHVNDELRPITFYQRDTDHPVVFYNQYTMLLLSRLSSFTFPEYSPDRTDYVISELQILKNVYPSGIPHAFPYVPPSGMWIAKDKSITDVVEASGSLPETKNMPISPSGVASADPSGFTFSENIEPASNNTLALEIYRDGILIN
jgi:hypothetical protein